MAVTVEDIITRKEGQTFDCKSVRIEPKALAVPLVAMANADGGTIAIGVSDKTRRTHFSRNPKIAQYLKAYKYVKEFGEGMDRIYRELAVNNTIEPKVHLDAFILKITVNKHEVGLTEKVTEKVPDVIEKLTENHQKLIEKVPDVIEKQNCVIENVIEKAKEEGFSMTDTHIKLLQMMLKNPYVSQADLAKVLRVH